jgi:allantoate deiminase
MAVHLDAIGNVCGRYEGGRPGLPCLMLGSHYDTVRDAGKWDGPLGVITAIACVADLNRRAVRLPFAIEVVGFADEEGVRFASTLLGSRAVAGTFDESVLNARDADGLTMREAMVRFGLDPEHVGAAARARRELHAYVELHIEQGPVLEQQNLPSAWSRRYQARRGWRRTSPVWLVTPARCRWRCGAMRWREPPNASWRSRNSARRTMQAWSAPSVPSPRCRARPSHSGKGLVYAGYPRAGRRPSQACGGRDRAADRGDRETARPVAADRRHPRKPHRALRAMAENASRGSGCAEGYGAFELPSGAGHDGMAMIDIADVAMLFVRCRGGISHHPAEHVEPADADAGARVLLRLIENFRPRA